MCLAVPARIIEKDGDKAVADAMGNKWNIRITLEVARRLFSDGTTNSATPQN